MTLDEAKRAIEAIIFVSGDPVPLRDLSRWLEIDEATAEALLRQLSLEYSDARRGIRVMEIAGGWQFCTDPEMSPYINIMAGQRKNSNLSQAALEALAIIAYKQPITRGEIEQIRGVNSDGVISVLLERELIQEVGRKDSIGRPVLFGVTPKFLRHFGLKSVDELPRLGDIDDLGGIFDAQDHGV